MTFIYADYIVTRSPSVTYGVSFLPEGAFREFSPKKHHQRNSLVVFGASSQKMWNRWEGPLPAVIRFQTPKYRLDAPVAGQDR